MSTIVCEVGQDAPPLCLLPWQENPHGLVSLWDMLQLYAHAFIKVLEELGEVEREWFRPQTNIEVKLNAFGVNLGNLKNTCEGLRLTSAIKQLRTIIDTLRTVDKEDPEWARVIPSLTAELRRRVVEDLEDRVFLSLDSEKIIEFYKPRSTIAMGLFGVMPKSPDEVFGEAVCKSFPSAVYDLSEAIQCLVLERGNADVPRFCQPVITENFSTSANSLGVR